MAASWSRNTSPGVPIEHVRAQEILSSLFHLSAKAALNDADTLSITGLHWSTICMYAMSAMKQYQSVNTNAQVLEASPHRLVQMLMEGALTRLAQARGAMERGDIALKGSLIGKAIGIVGGLREGVNLEAGGELAANLDSLYAYLTTRLTEANLKNDPALIEEVAGLLRDVKAGWDGISQ